MSSLASVSVPAEAAGQAGLPVFAFGTVEPLPVLVASSTTATASSQPLSVAVAYESLHARLRAIEACQRSFPEDYAGAKPSCSWWSFEFLKYPGLLEAATRAAADADVILCSILSLDELPAAVKAWADQWLQTQRSKEGTF